MMSLYVNIQTGNRKAWLSNMDILKQLAEELNIRVEQVQATVQLIDEGNTIPFIARYRKEVTGSLDDEVLRNLDERLTYLRNLCQYPQLIFLELLCILGRNGLLQILHLGIIQFFLLS